MVRSSTATEWVSVSARSREFGEGDIGRREVDGRETEIERREVEREGLPIGKERLDVEKDCLGTEMECREIVDGGTTLMSCEVDRLDVDMEGAVLDVCRLFLYAALDFRMGFSGTAEL